MQKPVQVHQFDPVIYPVKLWVSFTKDLSPIADRFKQINNKEFNSEFKDCLDAFTQPVIEKETGLYGIIVVFRDKKVSTSLMAHEAAHVNQLIWTRISEDTIGMEAEAYLVQWIVDCLDQVNRNKFKV